MGEAAQGEEAAKVHEHAHTEEALAEQPHAESQEDDEVPATEQKEGFVPSLPAAVPDNAGPGEEAYDDGSADRSAPDNLSGDHEEYTETWEAPDGEAEHAAPEEYHETGYENQEAGADEYENANNVALDELAPPEDGVGGGEGEDSMTDEVTTEHDEDADGGEPSLTLDCPPDR